MKESIFATRTEFAGRHLGPRPHELEQMLATLGFKTLEEMQAQVVPRQIVSNHQFEALGEGLSEFETLKRLKGIMSQNKVYKSYLGQGFADCLTPSPILRNVFENPNWYTAYTPYQPEIAQGRLEALLNFQTMITDLTGMEISNASLLDEGTAAAEAMAMALAISKSTQLNFFVHEGLHPHVIEVLKTRAEPLGLNLVVGELSALALQSEWVGAILAYPHTSGEVLDLKTATKEVHDKKGLVIVDAELFSLTMLQPPGEWGADIVVGLAQRFGVPLGYGGPHAAFLATKDAHKRLLPGRLVGVSVDANGKKALRLTLQTREQHIRREKATSNICTAQVLLANMASFYGVYHGPEGLLKIAKRMHGLTQILVQGLKQKNITVLTKNFFDTITFEVADVKKIESESLKAQINLRYFGGNRVGVSINETTTLEDIDQLLALITGDSSFAGFSEKLVNTLTDVNLPTALQRTSKYMTHPTFHRYRSETELMRYIQTLQSKDVTLTNSMIPLGSCTMKLNAATELIPVSWPEVNRIHPLVPPDQVKGYQILFDDLEKKLCDITGFAAVSLQPNAGSQGEYAGLLVIRKYHHTRGESHRDVCLIPTSAHGTNPASAVMAGMKVVLVACDSNGNVDLEDLKKKAMEHSKNLAALMVTYPSTHGVFEESIKTICALIHEHGGQVYMDGANLNALVGVCRPGEFGPDVSHMNLHKTFAIPHGGGGPGVGPIGVAAHLVDYLPRHQSFPSMGGQSGISSTTSAPWGSASILPISWCYITMMGAEGLRQATLISILSANYCAKKLAAQYPILYKGKEGLVAHECIIDLRQFKAFGVDVNDVAKRLMDFGFHAPTMSWPVAGTMMIEPTESESLAEINRFIDAMLTIHSEIKAIQDGKISADQSPLRHAPHTAEVLLADEWSRPYSRTQAAFPVPWVRANKYWPPVGRVDNAFGDRNVVCSCPPLEDYQ